MEQVKWAMVESAREECGSVRVGGGKPKGEWWSDQVKAMVKRKEDTWKEVLGVRNKDARERCLEVYKEENINIKCAFVKVRRRSKNSLEGG